MKKSAYNEAKTTGELTKQIANTFITNGLSLTTAESCTGGHLAAALCAEANTAAFYDIGIITFSDSAKQKMLGVQAGTLEKFTAVSEQTVREMSEGARIRAGTDISIAISGYAGPDGGEDGTPAGTVWFAWDFRGKVATKREFFSGECQDVIEKAVCYSLAVLVEKVSAWQRH
ncbi:2-oxo-tetronate isomerase [Citrobacter amalonaticus]|uniref:2-oxo-tetronate isomerase n=1 Tax=Citrobacter amalonaticus TaxID=35703 RepID=UPI0019071E40|nr:2-oxo-tetronate isomerase [Citrobacter amalonaticus]MBJ9276481.1 2-oxo-tetronate isomerase [Citrobacter amalonaticus]